MRLKIELKGSFIEPAMLWHINVREKEYHLQTKLQIQQRKDAGNK